MKPASSLFAKILAWFFLNLILVAAAFGAFFAFQPHVNLHAIFGQQGADRLRSAGMLIYHDINMAPRTNWKAILARHAEIHRVDFMLVLEDGTCFSSTECHLPQKAIKRIKIALQHKPPWQAFSAPRPAGEPKQQPEKGAFDQAGNLRKDDTIGRKPPRPLREYGRKPNLILRTRNPTRYWTGIRVPLYSGSHRPPVPAILLAVSDSVTGKGFFFDPLPLMVVAVTVILISVLFWIPMVRNITRPLARMTRATEEIARGRFDVPIRESREDEIGRLAKAIGHMTARLSAFVKGQKRFLGDVAHELGSPIARLQFGLGALEQRIDKENRPRLVDVMEDVDHMSNLVNELLAFSRADMNSKTVKLEQVDLLAVVQAAIKREATPTSEIIVHIDPAIRVTASAELLTRAIANLLRNAVKYAKDAGPIRVSAEKRGGAVEIEVRDAGPGVAEDLLDQLFEPFFRPEASRDRDSGGVGLGLAIVKTCVETCNGSVSARNLQPTGFAVTILLNTIPVSPKG
jgi:two-component system sensor histidine kinase CpxA